MLYNVIGVFEQLRHSSKLQNTSFFVWLKVTKAHGSPFYFVWVNYCFYSIDVIYRDIIKVGNGLIWYIKLWAFCLLVSARRGTGKWSLYPGLQYSGARGGPVLLLLHRITRVVHKYVYLYICMNTGVYLEIRFDFNYLA